ncbi:undecaprenyldiphospho-muramoylpentapeptide beta-N-acetylglucosaminyltransferase [Heyndrickxia sporothermodurans]|uniref:UDP-N-acetylglucosamine--N-acetylmuramyl-(pentapeptide) pyrophosphoryl-undecaprenol N-acetylglucosamine transferase n=1 Tax=Heyndrickxia sporothermodurans TaxID=46224 RepID=A0A150L2T5_9BACI|nr:undecaprenyldiphospho-muramoylpentapeptide beta-N-acetylglucosaminyltransferase [Heyndrickxia sporothermodurans]KYD06657.1 UDP-N-acetylglucosamine--N-acetylmuramyl-(pentapeptide) pyrophosphoryl-undecaprenol N-acetylglucosamine transferase [Heyndrickxia sporothermodurans]MBL5766253.1 undecaprenyldiphospho-muramoylpentapeptide beta-N-acetylglucosaminyltransferase [Heyndrickxia sporothermodurans]MBL5769693.1 undecaprenyldiphospho-muramoylpentapeptide beta-N-acetylglucosaminyltransferase [Heyndri
MFKKKIVFTGGGTAGHVTPNIAIIKEMDRSKWDIHYIGSKKGIEKDLITQINIPYYGISSGKLRRYIDFENVKDIFRVLKGCLQARRILKKLKPNLIFSKGGFVSVPVIIAAKSLKIPIFIHESDMTPGLANKISQRFATKIFTSFAETKKYFPEQKTMVIGSPIRKEILNGSWEKGRDFLDFNTYQPILTIMGGSLGSKKVNEAVRSSLNQLIGKYQIVHLCGKGNIDNKLLNIPGYKQFEYINDELPDILAATDIVITRGGSNAIFEFLALKIPMIIIPLTKQQSRGDQILNAKAFEDKGYSLTLEEENLTNDSLVSSLDFVMSKKEKYQTAMSTSEQGNALQVLVDEINKYL